jgi:hypothetical protein
VLLSPRWWQEINPYCLQKFIDILRLRTIYGVTDYTPSGQFVRPDQLFNFRALAAYLFPGNAAAALPHEATVLAVTGNFVESVLLDSAQVRFRGGNRVVMAWHDRGR